MAVGVREGRVADVRAALRVAARLRGLARRGVPDLADVDAAADQLGAGGLDVVDDQQQALQGLGRRRRAGPNWIEAGEPGGVNCTRADLLG